MKLNIKKTNGKLFILHGDNNPLDVSPSPSTFSISRPQGEDRCRIDLDGVMLANEKFEDTIINGIQVTTDNWSALKEAVATPEQKGGAGGGTDIDINGNENITTEGTTQAFLQSLHGNVKDGDNIRGHVKLTDSPFPGGAEVKGTIFQVTDDTLYAQFELYSPSIPTHRAFLVYKTGVSTVAWSLYGIVTGDIIDELSYGIVYDTSLNVSTSTLVGNRELHRTRPVHNRMVGCLVADDGTINKELGTSWTGETRDGSAGQVMVKMPVDCYYKETRIGTINEVRFSEYPLAGFTRIGDVFAYGKKKLFISAYEAVMDRTNLKLSSVVNTSAQYRGGANSATHQGWDGTYRSLLGCPATNISLTNFRTYARNRGSMWYPNLYRAHHLLYLLYIVEYANLNCQLDYNPELTAEGFRQGGLGAGVTTLASADWSTYNGSYPFIPCGYTDELGNGTGVKDFTMPSEYPTPLTVQVPRYRGIENPFGHLWKWTDGIRFRIQADDAGALSELYEAISPDVFGSEDLANYLLKGNVPRANGYVKEMLEGNLIPQLATGASSTYPFGVNWYTSIPASGEAIRGCLFGGGANSGASAGVACAYSHNAVTNASATIGSRLCLLA